MSDSEGVVSGAPPPRMPPRAKSAYHPRRARLSTNSVDVTTATATTTTTSTTTTATTHTSNTDGNAPVTTRVPLRRRASFATVPDSKPPIRRGMSVVPRRRGSGAATFVGVRQTRGGGGESDGLRTAEERAFAEEVRAARAKAAAGKEEPAICGMCGNCREGAAAMPEWAPERLAKMTPDERRMVLMNVRAKEEAGKIASEIRMRNLQNGIIGIPNNPATNGINHARPPLRRQSSRLSAVLAPGNNSDARRRPKYIAKPSPERAQQRIREDVKSSIENKEKDETMMQQQQTNQLIPPQPQVPATEMDLFGASDSDTAIDCADCDHLETRVKDLEEQLDVLREVVMASGGDPAVSSTSDSLDLESPGRTKKKPAWHERVLGTFVGAPPGSETARLKDEVGALRKATNVLFEKLQDADSKRAGK